ncbi:phage major capsid protein [Bacteroides faecis]|uniref:phage major capsid protein n=1 Tax=Bacteroides faecis TaxID=674529 RepID=UPI00216445C1|nr:phage major capsid protein [Bacteroides faecis]UVR67725.1 phage major capsid protein [Bacteroides faecis]UVS37043.1 phage major capsid protein [Bacteroides faecis]
MPEKKIKFKDFLDTQGLSEDESKVFDTFSKGLDSFMEALYKQYMEDQIDSKELKKSLDEATQSIEELKSEIKGLADSKSVNDRLKEFGDTIVRIKAATEKTKDGKREIKSLGDQIADACKEFVVESNGVKKINVEALKEKGGVKFDVVMKAASAPVMTTGGAPVAGGITIDDQISVDPRKRASIRDLANVASISTPTVVYAQLKDVEGDAAWVPEGGLKPSMTAEVDTVSLTAGKIALTAKITTEVMQDIPQLEKEIEAEILNKIGLKEEDGIFNGTGTGGQIQGVSDSLPAFSLTGIEISKSPNMYDAIVAAYTQIVSTSNMAYSPNAIRMNPVDYANMQLTKNDNGDYIRPFKIGDELITGLRVVQNPNVPVGSFQMGDFRYLFIRDYVVLSLNFGWENDDFTKNLVTILGEKRMLAYIKSQYKTAFVADTFANVITAITKSVA